VILKGAFIVGSLFSVAMIQALGSPQHINYSVVAIEYVGESDKPITPIVISDSKASADWYRKSVLKRRKSELTYVHVVSALLLDKLIADVEFNKDRIQQRQKNNPSFFEAVSLTIITPKNRHTYFYETRKAIPLLGSIRESCKDYDSLDSDLSHFQNRIRP
jgi:hypothetical protein